MIQILQPLMQYSSVPFILIQNSTDLNIFYIFIYFCLISLITLLVHHILQHRRAGCFINTQMLEKRKNVEGNVISVAWDILNDSVINTRASYARNLKFISKSEVPLSRYSSWFSSTPPGKMTGSPSKFSTAYSFKILSKLLFTHHYTFTLHKRL
jgi:hypothetical protein